MNEGKGYEEFDEADQEDIQLLLTDPEAYERLEAQAMSNTKYYEDELRWMKAQDEPQNQPRPSAWQRAKTYLFSLFA